MMINKIEELVKYLYKDSEDFENYSDKEEFLFKTPGCPAKRLLVLEVALGTMPETYKDFISVYDFNKVSIGYFGLSPLPYDTTDIVDALIKANIEESFLPRKFLEKNGLIWIGSNNDYTVYVATESSRFKEGEIILIDEEILRDIDNPRECDIQRLAKDFEQFLIAAGNLNQVHREINDDNSNWEEKKLEFIDRLKQLGVDEIYHKAWLSVF